MSGAAKDRADRLRARDLPKPQQQLEVAPPPPEEVEAPPEPEPPPPPAPPKRSQKRPGTKRHTVDITDARHAELAMWRMETALALGLPALSGQDVLETIINVLLDDETVARRVRARLEETRAGS